MESNLENQESWESFHRELQGILLGEIALRQNMLSNLHQQEYVLLVGDLELKNSLHIECKEMASKLKREAQKRNFLLKKMIGLLPEDQSVEEIEDLFQSGRQEEGEILLLYEQLRVLTEKIHNQKMRNKTLYALIQRGGNMEIQASVLQVQPMYLEGKGGKPLLITIDYPEEDGGKVEKL